MQSQWAVIFGLLFFSVSAIAEEKSTDGKLRLDSPIRYDHYYVDYRVSGDGEFVETVDFLISVLKESAIESSKNDSVSYSASYERIEVVSAYTQKADGRRIEVPKSNYQVKVNQGQDGGGPVFSDRATMTVVYPDVEVGDAVGFSYKRFQTEPLFPGSFSARLSFSDQLPYDDVKVSINLPSAIWTQHHASQMEEKIHETDGRKFYEWKWKNSDPVKRDVGNYSVVYDLDQRPGVSFSTFKTYEDIARAYGVRATPKAAVTERIQALADEIAGDAATPREQARRLYDWVATHISYAGNCIGVGAVVPHDTAAILENLMGDCKDHATLLQALLAAKGISSTQALINAGNVYRLPKVPVPGVVNHVINYIPSLDLFADSTAPDIPFGMLPMSAADKNALLVDGFKEDLRTPATPVGQNDQRMVSDINIKSDGAIDGTIEVELKGMYGAKSRSRMRDLTKDSEENIVERVFQANDHIGSGTLEKDDPTELTDSYHYKVEFKMDDFIQRPGAGAFRIAPLFYSESPIGAFLGAAIDPVATTDYVCTNGSSVEEYKFHFPKEMKILAVPDDVEINEGVYSYKATYARKGGTLTVKRSIEDKTEGHVCKPEVSAAEKSFATKVWQNVRSQVVYQ